jgi:hypothetical protein
MENVKLIIVKLILVGNMKDKLDNVLSTNIPEFPKQVRTKIPELNLPTL